jgi:hypothetical protein
VAHLVLCRRQRLDHTLVETSPGGCVALADIDKIRLKRSQ